MGRPELPIWSLERVLGIGHYDRFRERTSIGDRAASGGLTMIGVTPTGHASGTSVVVVVSITALASVVKLYLMWRRRGRNG